MLFSTLIDSEAEGFGGVETHYESTPSSLSFQTFFATLTTGIHQNLVLFADFSLISVKFPIDP